MSQLNRTKQTDDTETNIVLTSKYMYFEPKKMYDKCAVFDFDGTICAKANGAKMFYAENDPNNLVFYYNVLKTLKELRKQKIQVVVISNQLNITDEKLQLFEEFLKLTKYKVYLLIAHKDNKYRKPNTGFLKLLKDKEILYYCGDAIGEEHSSFPPYRWSSSDYDFAKDNDIKFKRPTKIFGSNYETIEPEEDIIIMMGNMGSGKTTLAKRLESLGYVRFSQDELGDLKKKENKDKVIKALSKGKKVILDATHGNFKNRSPWESLAHTKNKSYVILWCVRDGRPFNSLREKPIKEVAYSTYTKYFCYPNEENYIIIS